MNDSRDALRNAGWALIVFGLLDIGLMVYCILHQQSYSSSFNIFAVIAGILLLRGHLGTARYVTWFLAFVLGGFVAAVFVLFPFLEPFDLLLARVRLEPVTVCIAVLGALGALGLLAWIYRQLRAPAVIQARVRAGQNASSPRSAFFLGGLVAVVAAMAVQLVAHADATATALRLARAKEGSAYSYHVTRISVAGDHGRASVTAYNRERIENVDVDW